MWRIRYDEVLRQASLLSDLQVMPEGDLTEVGEHGITLVSLICGGDTDGCQSGGQKARINLARCIYARAKTVYMDDILSAVDAHTSQFISKECLRGSLLRGRTVVLVTQHVGLCLPAADFLVSLKDGRVEQACPAYEAETLHLMSPSQPSLNKLEEAPASAKHVSTPAEEAQVTCTKPKLLRQAGLHPTITGWFLPLQEDSTTG